ncbi:MAG: hydrogenase maturation nickel metallochaperone HypA [Acetobacteraceae bacterium]|nr:hydrogenase maturation nickel metallochaperone HypA [Acetobacteraceae bacterium]
MHELALVDQMIRILRTKAREHGATRITRVRVVVGGLSCASPWALRFAFEALTRPQRPEAAGPLQADGLLAGAALDIVERPAVARCPRCGQEFPLDEAMAACPRCGSAGKVISGTEVYLESFEAEVPEGPEGTPKDQVEEPKEDPACLRR